VSYVSYSDVIAGLHERFLTIPGLAQYNDDGELVTILDYEPTAIHVAPLIYTLLDRFERKRDGQITTMRYRILNRLVIQWQDQERAEQQLKPFVHTIPASVDTDPTLGGRITMGLAHISDAESGFAIIAGTKYRVLDCYATATTKAPFQSGI
jgi:hypothetical protein